MKRAAALALLLSLAACAAWRSARSHERFPTGTWVVRRHVMPTESPAPDAIAQAYLGKSARFTEDWIDDLNHSAAPCAPGPYRLYARELPQEDLFDGRAGGYSLKDLGLPSPMAYEVQTYCGSFYLSWDRTQLLLPRPGYLLILEPEGRVHFERTPTPDLRTPTPLVEHLDFSPKTPVIGR